MTRGKRILLRIALLIGAAVLLCLAGCQRLERGSTIGAAVLFAYAMIVFVAFVVFLRPEVKPRR